jgi:hypothetical protein
MTQVKIESEVPCVFSETGTHRVTMVFAEVETELREGYREGLQLVHLSCECGEDEAHISETLDTDAKCCGLVRDDVRLAASGEDPRERDPITANALKQIKSNNAALHRMRDERREPVEHVMKLERDANRALPAGFEFRLMRARAECGTDRPIGAQIFAVRSWRRDIAIATYIGRGGWRMAEEHEHIVDQAAGDEDTQIKIKYASSYRKAMESVTCKTCHAKMNPSSRVSHLESARHLKRVRARLDDAMMLVSERLGRRWL